MSHSSENDRRAMKIGTSLLRRGAIAAAALAALALVGKPQPALNQVDSSVSAAKEAAKAASRAMTFTQEPESTK